MEQTGFYAGSFDPVTLGHIDIIERAAKIFGRLVIGVGVHHDKKSLFKSDERVMMLQDEASAIASKLNKSIEVVTFDGLVVDAAKQAQANVIVRGVRDGTDFDYEAQMAGMNYAVCSDVDTVFLVSSSKVRHIAATFVRQIAAMGGDVSSFVSPDVLKQLQLKFPQN